MEKQLFRQKSLERISSPEELHDYMRVTSPRLWMILTAIALLLGGFIVFAATTRMESTQKISVTSRFGSAICYIPQNLEGQIKVGMPVRFAGQTGIIFYMDHQIQYRLNVTMESSAPMESPNYLMTFGESRDIAMDENGNIAEPTVFIENGENGMTLSVYTEDEVLRKLNGGDVRVCFWTMEEDEDGKLILKNGHLATVSGYEKITLTEATVKLDNPNAEIPDGIYEAEIVTESTTPISFLWN